MGIITAKPRLYFLCLSAFVTGFTIASWMRLNVGTVRNVGVPNVFNSLELRNRKNEVGFKSGNQGFSETSQHNEPSTTRHFQDVRVLCWIMTSPATLTSNAAHIRDTWGRRCNVTLFFSSESNASFPAIGLPVKEGYDYIWAKTREAFRYIYCNHFNDADWFLKADDDTYVIVENLRYFLSDKNTSDPVFYGHNFKYANIEYMSGGAGYVLSREALKRFIGIMDDDRVCSVNATKRSEDLEMGHCLGNAGVVAGDSRDHLNRTRFFPFRLASFLIKGTLARFGWYWQYAVYKQIEGEDCCSDYVISIHYVNANAMHYLEFVVYNLRAAQPPKKRRNGQRK